MMYAATVLALLSAGGDFGYEAREWASQAALTLPRLTNREWSRTSECPEARRRAWDAYRRQTLAALDDLLPADRPYWPDCDWAGLTLVRDADEADRWHGWLGLFDPPPWLCVGAQIYVESPVTYLYGVWVTHRERTKQVLVSYALATGDLEWPTRVIRRGADAEAESKRIVEPEYVWYILWLRRPNLLKGYHR